MSRWIVFLGFVAILGSGSAACSGGVTLAPHLNRERDLAPAAAAGRYGVVMDRASAFENQNLKSTTVHWYRMWRASAMIGLGQVQQAIELIDQVLADISSGSGTPPQADRLRVFAYDLRAQAALLQGRPRDALGDLERSFSLATDLQLETRSDCDQPMMLAARSRQIEDVAKRAGDAARASSAHVAMGRHLEKWSKCLAEKDFPGMSVVSSIATALSAESAAPIAAAPVQAPVQAPAQPQPPVEAPKGKGQKGAAPVQAPVQAPAQPQSGALAAMPSAEAQYAPVDATPWRDAIESVLALAGKHAQGAKGDVVIRTDGQHHALRIRVSLPKFDNADQLIPVFRSTVVFFEQARNVTPRVERVLVTVDGPGGPITILAQKNDVLELFQERVDPPTFLKRLVRIM